jgi:hypothetical protein
MDAKIERVQSAAVMQRFACRFMRLVTCLVAGLGATTGCGHGATGSAAQVPEQYRSDIANLCDVVARSGAEQLGAGARAYTTATWLAANLKTQEARDYMIRIQPLVGEPKATALEAEARRVGLSGCALADAWRAAAPSR